MVNNLQDCSNWVALKWYLILRHVTSLTPWSLSVPLPVSTQSTVIIHLCLPPEFADARTMLIFEAVQHGG